MQSLLANMFLPSSRRRGHGEKLLLDPVLGPARFNGTWLVRFWQIVFARIVGHGKLLQRWRFARFASGGRELKRDYNCNAEF